MNKKLLFSSLLCICAAFAGIVVSTFAWFIAKRNVDDPMQNMRVVNPGFGEATLIVHPVLEINSTRTIYKFDIDEAEELPTYDESEIIYSKYEKALVFEVQFTPNYECTYNISFKNNHSDFSNEEENYLSNCIDVYTAEYVDDNIDEVDVQKNGSRNTFVSYTGSMLTENIVIQSKTSLFNYGNHTAGTSDVGVMVIYYFIVEYNMDLLEYISNTIDNEDGEAREQTFFSSDIYFEISEVHENG